MNEEKLKERLEEAINPETFDVIEYAEDQPLADDTVVVYTHVAKSRELSKLLAERRAILTRRAEGAKQSGGTAYDLSIADEDQDTDLDDDINALIADLEHTALTFHLQSVPPALVRAMEKASIAKADKNWSDEQKEAHNQKRMAEILTKAIVKVVRGDGAVDSKPWDADRLMAFEEAVYAEQAKILVGGLYDIVYTGQVFEEAITVDF